MTGAVLPNIEGRRQTAPSQTASSLHNAYYCLQWNH